MFLKYLILFLLFEVQPILWSRPVPCLLPLWLFKPVVRTNILRETMLLYLVGCYKMARELFYVIFGPSY